MKHRRGLSLGTAAALVLTAIVLITSLTVLSRLRNTDAALTIGQIADALTLPENWNARVNEMPGKDAPVTTAAPTATPAGLLLLSPIGTPQPTAAATPAVSTDRTVTLTFGGSVAISGDVRRSCYFSGASTYDFTELLDQVRTSFTGDLTLVTLQNLVDGTKYSDLLAPAELLTAMHDNGIDMAALGFNRCLDKNAAALQNTVVSAKSAGLKTVGAYSNESDAAPSARILNIGGVKVAMLHYTDGLASSALKKLDKAGTDWIVPVPDRAAEEIRAVRQLGAEIIIVSMNWGKGSGSSASKSMKTTAQALADAGADVIVGAGSGAVQPVVTLTAQDGRRVLCAYSLGCLMTESRSDNSVAGLLLHVTLTVNSQGKITQTAAAGTPTYIWHYKQDGEYHFRAISCLNAPDGMDASQQKAMKAAMSRVVKKLGKDTPVQIPDAE